MFDNVTIGNFIATTDGSTDQYKINGFMEVNDLRIENLVLPKSVRFFIYTASSGTPTVNGNIYVGNIDVIEGGGGEWRSPDIRGGTFGMDFVVKGSITIAPTSDTTQNNSSMLTFGGTNTNGFLNLLQSAKMRQLTLQLAIRRPCTSTPLMLGLLLNSPGQIRREIHQTGR